MAAPLFASQGERVEVGPAALAPMFGGAGERVGSGKPAFSGELVDETGILDRAASAFSNFVGSIWRNPVGDDARLQAFSGGLQNAPMAEAPPLQIGQVPEVKEVVGDIWRRPLGITPEDAGKFENAGIFAKTPQDVNLPRTVARSVIESGAYLGDTALRGINTGILAPIIAGTSAAKQLGAEPSSADRFGRDLYVFAQTAPMAGMGAPPIVRAPRFSGEPVKPPDGAPPRAVEVAPEGVARTSEPAPQLAPTASEIKLMNEHLKVRPDLDPATVQWPHQRIGDLLEETKKELPRGYRAEPKVYETSPAQDGSAMWPYRKVEVYGPEGELVGAVQFRADLDSPWFRELRETGKQKGVYESAIAAAEDAGGGPDIRSRYQQLAVQTGDKIPAANDAVPAGTRAAPAIPDEALAAFRSELQRQPQSILDRVAREENRPELRPLIEEEFRRRNREAPAFVEPTPPVASETVKPARPAPAEDPFPSIRVPLASGKSAPWKGPMDLVTWLRTQGGVRDMVGELKTSGINNWPRNIEFAGGEWKLGGLVRDNGMPLDQAAVRAWEAGFFPEMQAAPDVATFIEAMRDTYNARTFAGRRFTEDDYARIDQFRARQRDPDAEANALGLDISGMTDRQALDAVDSLRTRLDTETPRPVTEAEVRGSAPPIGSATSPQGADFLQNWRSAGNRPEGDRAGNINVAKLESVEDIKKALGKTARQNDDFAVARRGVQSQADTSALADMLGMTPAELSKRRFGQAFNAEEALAARRLLADATDDLIAKARTAKAANSDDNLLAFQAAYNRLVAIQEQVAGMTAEAGRTLQSFKITAASEAARAKAVRNIVDLAGREKVETLVDAVASMNDPAAVARLANQSFKAKTSDKILELFYNSILSGPRTHAVNILSNTLTALWQIPEQAVAAGLGAFRRGPEKVFAGEIPQRVFGALEGSKEGFRLGKEAFIKEEPSDAMSKLEVRRQKAISGLKGEVVRVPTRLLMAEDEFFKAVSRRMEINALAVRQASMEGKTGRAFTERVAELRNAPTEAMMEKARDAARYHTYQSPLGPTMQNIIGGIENLPGWARIPARVVAPFIRTPVNLGLYAVERTPLALASRRMRADLMGENGAAAADTARARMLIGTTLAVGIVAQAMEGKITGSGPRSSDEKRIWENTGAQPFSIRVGDKWYSYQQMQPWAYTLGIAADIPQIVRAAGEKRGEWDKKLDEVALGLVVSMARNIADKQWFGGIVDIGAVIEDPERYGSGWVKRIAGAMVPSAVAQLAGADDPVIRDSRNTLDHLMSRVGLTEELPPSRDIWGEPRMRPDTLGPRVLSPITVKTQKNDKASDELARLKLNVEPPERAMQLGQMDKDFKVELTPREYDDLSRIAGQLARFGVEGVVKLPSYAAWPDAVKAKEIRNVFDTARKIARAEVQTLHPDILRRLAQAKGEELTRPARNMPVELRP